jgi:hypothetical protein
MDKVRPDQHGVYDREILCAKCDGQLGHYDDYAIKVCRTFDAKHREFDDGRFLLPDINGDKLAKFALAVLWGASISTRLEFKRVDLGPYVDVAKEVLFGEKPLKDFTAYELMVLRFKSRHSGVIGFPARMTGARVTVWGFAAGGFRFMAKMDKRRWPDGLPNEMIVNGNNELHGYVVDQELSPEHRLIVKMAGADRERRAQRQP